MFRTKPVWLAASPVRARLVLLATLALLLASLLPASASGPLAPGRALAGHTPSPASVTIAGSLQSELGCAGDWDPACAQTHMTDGGNGVWKLGGSLPTGSYEYKVALNDSWTENYGAGGQANGGNIALNLAADRSVSFYYDHKTHYIADSVRNTIYTIPGSFNSELGCAGDWSPDCLRTFMSDVDGDGVFTFVTTDIPPGDYEFKVATNESWSNPNYGQGGGGANVPFSVAQARSTVTFSFDTGTNTPTVVVKGGAPAHDNTVEWDGLRHDSRDTLYRSPGGAVEAGTPVRIRFRTFHDDVTSVKLRVYDVDAGGQKLIAMKVAATGVSCAQADLADASCDFWQATLPNAVPANVWYRFIVTDGTDTDYYADNTSALDGGLGAASDDPIDNSYALLVSVPGFTSPAWAKRAVIYQLFPDRFRNGRSDNDPRTGDRRYDDPVLRLKWGTNPEGFCRNYADGGVNCPWRFGAPAGDTSTKEQPRGRDYMGGDLRGVDQQLDYLKSIGISTIYLNPVFDAGSNHGYDTQDYTKIDPYFGTQKDWDNLAKHARDRGMRLILDGVFNHMSSDSPFFDRYGRYATVGACESVNSPYRSWFHFRAPTGNEPATCYDAQGNKTLYYDGWFGFDSIPVIDKSNLAVKAYFLTGQNSIAKRWLVAGAGGWRLDVSGDSSFPADYWSTFRSVVKATKPDALTISETWQKDSTLLRMLRGDRLDTTMNYRLRDAVIGFLAPGAFDSKGFGDSGRIISPSEFLGRLSSIREDYPDAAYYTLMNLLDSHDTERILWTLTPGQETTADKEGNAANVAAGKARVRMASLIQFTLPGAPTIWSGDEVGVTGDDDPDDRRTYPWADLGFSPDTTMRAHYAALATLRSSTPALTDGDFVGLLADDAAGVAAYGRKTSSQAAIVVLNRSGSARTVHVPLADWLRDGVAFTNRLAVNGASTASATTAGGELVVDLPANGAAVFATGTVDLAGPAAPANLRLTKQADRTVSIAWDAVAGAASYDVWTSPVAGGGYTRVTTSPVTATTFTLTDLPNGVPVHIVVTANDAAGNRGAFSAEVTGVPRYEIGWSNVQWPPTLNHVISTTTRTDNVYGQVWIDGVTSAPGQTVGLRAQLGMGPDGSNPDGNDAWTWVDASFNGDSGNNDEFVASLLPEVTGMFDYAYRYTTTNGAEWVYADLDGSPNGYSPAQAGALTVTSSGDTTAPGTPAGLRVTSASPAGIELAWDAVAGDPSLYGYEVLRGDAAGGPYTTIALVTAPAYTDLAVDTGATYAYVVRSLDTSFNRSGLSAEVLATAELRTVTLTFNVTVPASTDGTGKQVFIAGFLDRLDGGNPQWDPGGVSLTRVDATHWTITFTGKESTQLEYKYTLGSWDFVEKDAGCGEVANRQLTLSYGASGVQTVNDTIANWRNVAPCGN